MWERKGFYELRDFCLSCEGVTADTKKVVGTKCTQIMKSAETKRRETGVFILWLISKSLQNAHTPFLFNWNLLDTTPVK